MNKPKYKYTGTFEVSSYGSGTQIVTKECQCRSFYQAFILLSVYGITENEHYVLQSITDASGHKVFVKDSWDVKPFRLPIKFNGQEYSAIEKFDCHTISLINQRGNGYTTVIPISPVDYRRKSETKAKVVITDKDGYINFWCYDDLGQGYIMEIPTYLENEIAIAMQAAKDFELLKN